MSLTTQTLPKKRTVLENKNFRNMKLKELRTILKTQKHPKMVVEKLSQFPRSNFEVKN